MTNATPQPESAPSDTTNDYGRLMRWFGIWFIAGMAPFLGAMKLPVFRALIELYPDSLQIWLIPLSSIFMGMMAVVVEFVAARKTEESNVTRWFIRTTIAFAAALLLLIVVYIFTVVHVAQTFARGPNEPPGFIHQTIITGSRSVPPQPRGSECKCRQGQPATRCLGGISLNPDNIETCFGSTWIGLVTLALVLLYLVVTGSFAAAVGLLVIARRSAATALIAARTS